MIGLFIEETMPDDSYAIVWRQGENETIADALCVLKTHLSPNHLELWSKSWANSPKGFAPIAFREKQSSMVMLGHTTAMLAGLTKTNDVLK